MLIRSSFAIALFTALMGVAGDVWQFFAFRALMGVFAGFSSAAIALVAHQVPEDRLGYSLGWLSTGQLVGSLAGPIIGGGLADLTGSYRIPFYCTAAMIVVSLFLVMFTVHEQFTRPPKDAGGRSMVAGLLALVRSPTLLALFFVLLMAQFAVRTVQPVVTLYVKEMVGDLPNVATLAGLAFSITGVGNVIAAPFLGNRSDTLGYRRVLLICLAGAALTTLPQAFTTNYWVFTAERFAVGLFIGGLLPAANALVGRLVARSERGAVYGMTSSAMFMGNSLGPLLGGFIAAGFGLQLGVPADRGGDSDEPASGFITGCPNTRRLPGAEQNERRSPAANELDQRVRTNTSPGARSCARRKSSLCATGSGSPSFAASFPRAPRSRIMFSRKARPTSMPAIRRSVRCASANCSPPPTGHWSCTI